MTWSFPTYLQEYSTISAALPHVPLVGPAVGLPRWTAMLPEFIAAEPRVTEITLHKYPLQLCYIPRSWSIYPTIPHLLSPKASIGLAESVAPQVRLAHDNGLRIRIDEMNTISCGQAQTIGKSFATALWALNTLFAFARVGVDGINMHTYVGSSYALFRFHDRAGAWSGDRQPRVLRDADVRPGRAAEVAAAADRRRQAGRGRGVGDAGAGRRRPRGR